MIKQVGVQKIEKDPWIKIHFPSNQVVIHGYFIQSGFILQNWKLEGSNNDITWFIIDSHFNGQAIHSIIDGARFQCNSINSYCYFKLTQLNGDNISNNYLYLSFFELFGNVSK